MFKFEFTKFRRATIYSLGRAGGSSTVRELAGAVQNDLVDELDWDGWEPADFHLGLRVLCGEQELVSLSRDGNVAYLTSKGWTWLAEDRPWKPND